MATFQEVCERIDWGQLRHHKATLVLDYWSEQDSPVWGIIDLLDHLQDAAVQEGYSESDVFGSTIEEESNES
jgi:hypothetical protein